MGRDERLVERSWVKIFFYYFNYFFFLFVYFFIIFFFLLLQHTSCSDACPPTIADESSSPHLRRVPREFCLPRAVFCRFFTRIPLVSYLFLFFFNFHNLIRFHLIPDDLSDLSTQIGSYKVIEHFLGRNFSKIPPLNRRLE